MKTLNKFLAASAVALGLAAGAAVAMPGAWDGPDGCAPHWGHHRPDPERMAAFMKKRLDRLHADLKLTPAQEPAWTAFVEKEKPGPRADRPDYKTMEKMTTPERLDAMQKMAKEREAKMDARATAVKAFYAQLSPAQQKIFDGHFMHRPERREDRRDWQGKGGPEGDRPAPPPAR